ncbi:unnamed protein product [Moneuplotes crassus]|uniref:Sm domain-containing protein n=1 Tax=Euplotes crassus TaxID=5936 RepID=A0AAD1Y6S5_EUPCR|nr:unnamed protein product [Moneuplotes crassus]
MSVEENKAEELATQKMFPLELLELSINQKVLVIMIEQQEFVGTFRGFDPYFNCVLGNLNSPNDVTEYGYDKNGNRQVEAKLSSILLQGTHIVMIVPSPEEDEPEQKE